MNWNDYEAVWKRQELPVGAAVDVADLKATFETKRRKLYGVLVVRDFSEAGAGLLGSVAYVFIWWKMGAAGWPIGIAVLLMLGISSVFVRERFRVRRRRLSADAPLLTKVEADIAELRHQRSLVLSLWKWYLGPCAAAVIIVGITISRSRPSGDLARDPLFLGSFSLFNAFLFWFAWEINRRALRKRLEPRLEELEKLRRDLLSNG